MTEVSEGRPFQQTRMPCDEALLVQVKQISTIFDSLNVLVYVADLETHELLFMNAYGSSLFGEGAIGKPCYQVLQAGQRAQCPFCTNDRLIRAGVPEPPYVWEFQNTVTQRWFLCIDRAIRWIDGRLVRMEVAVDITERKRAEAERERLLAEIQRRAAQLEATITAMADGVIICGPDAEVLHMNVVAERLLSCPPAQRTLSLKERLSLLRLETVEGKPLPAEQAPIVRALEHGETAQGVVAGIVGVEGGTRWVSMSAVPIRAEDGGLGGAVVTLTDITSLRQLQDQREDYLHMISHDLRNPLTPIVGWASLLRRRLSEHGLAREANSAGVIEKSAQQMNGMIGELLESARLETRLPELRLQRTDLCQLVNDVIARVGRTEEQAGIQIQVSCPQGLPAVAVDRERVGRALTNLLVNALKYSWAESPVLVKLEQSDGHLIVAVQNEGEGILPEESPYVFERHYRARAGKKSEGLGLGLYIARLAVEAHGGSIWVESRLGQTTTFSFTLPLVPSDA